MANLQTIITFVKPLEVFTRDDQFDMEVKNLVPLEYADRECMSFVGRYFPNFETNLKSTKAAVLIISKKLGITLDMVSDDVIVLLVVDDAVAMGIDVIRKFFRFQKEPTVHPSAIIGNGTKISPSATIEPFVVIGENCVVGNDSIIRSNVFIGDSVKIGNNVIIHSNCSIGTDSLYTLRNDKGSTPISGIGEVIIEDDCQIFPNSTLGRALVGTTHLQKGVEVNCQCHIGHDVHVGERTIMGPGCIIAGHVKIGSKCWLGIGCHIKNRSTIGNNAYIGMGTIITGHVNDNEKILPLPSLKEADTQVILRHLLTIAKKENHV